MSGLERRSFQTNDGVTLSYLEGGGAGNMPLVLLPGWSQSANTFKFVLDGLCENYHVYALDHRGHGESEKPAWGYRISRLAKDFDDFLTALNLKKIHALGHSMGCAVIWCYMELFGQEVFSKLVLNDQRAATLRDSAWTDLQVEDMGATIAPEALYATKHALSGENSPAARRGRLKDMTSATLNASVFEWLLGENLKMPQDYAAKLLYNNWIGDWSDIIPRISVPTLLIGGRGSSTPWKTLVWQNRVISGSRLEIFEESEGGSHFIFVENPGKYLKVVRDFLG
ncbi:MAG: alpha/beta hydrolase [Spirochaetales bacterium]|jgi:pimeloyl-ACP methyl ester carboxylesterase|nr:alpha/beta hydrolase [Spirochaetales bacterium]